MDDRGHTHILTLTVIAFLVIVGAEQVYTWHREQALIKNTKATFSQASSQVRHVLEALGCSTDSYDKSIRALTQKIQDDPEALKASVETMRLLLNVLSEGKCRVPIRMQEGKQ